LPFPQGRRGTGISQSAEQRRRQNHWRQTSQQQKTRAARL